eukprot:TRINITY_DN109740_c0_g1_i1.p1 TRINITY_DN109740_c0_g1~~TRINITY_DN109740_c0_g1_i1.p1  ORF type:complete len:392 (-),score=48.06 TRINITY_DN109740_c0_g1_i1:67-1242(-)
MGASNSCERNRFSHLTCCSTKRQDSVPLGDPGSVLTVALAATKLFTVVGVSAYHTSILVDDMELFFDGGGIVLADAFASHEWSLGFDGVAETEVFPLGTTSWHVGNAIDMLGPFFQEGSYDVLRKNCNSFSDAAIYLLTGRAERLDGRFSRMERWVLACEPVSTNILRRLIKPREAAEPEEQDSTLDTHSDKVERSGTAGPRYVPNPMAADFNIEDVIAEIDLADAMRNHQPPVVGQSWLACCGNEKLQTPSMSEMSTREDAHAMHAVNRVWDPIIESAPKPSLDPFCQKEVQGPDNATLPGDLDDEDIEAAQSFHKNDAGPTHSCKIRTSGKLRPGDKLQQPVMRLRSPAPAPWTENLAEEIIWETDDATSPAAGLAVNELGFSMSDTGL